MRRKNIAACRTTTRIRRTSWTATTRIRVLIPRNLPRAMRFPVAAPTNPPRIATRTDRGRIAARSHLRVVTTRILAAAPKSPLRRMRAMPGPCIARLRRERNCSPLRRMIMAASTINESPSLWYVDKSV